MWNLHNSTTNSHLKTTLFLSSYVREWQAEHRNCMDKNILMILFIGLWIYVYSTYKLLIIFIYLIFWYP